MKNIRLDKEKLPDGCSLFDEILDKKYGRRGTPKRRVFEDRNRVLYYADILKDSRESKGWSKSQLSVKIGRDSLYIKDFEKGDINVDLKTFLAISNALDVDFVVKEIPCRR